MALKARYEAAALSWSASLIAGGSRPPPTWPI